ncbi:hypothetical protein D037_0683A, partial [Vibrio parahaemolyticus IDH02640]
MFKEVRKAR